MANNVQAITTYQGTRVPTSYGIRAPGSLAKAVILLLHFDQVALALLHFRQLAGQKTPDQKREPSRCHGKVDGDRNVGKASHFLAVEGEKKFGNLVAERNTGADQPHRDADV